jgi:hypothetical protein
MLEKAGKHPVKEENIMDRHKRDGVAAFIASNFINAIVDMGMVEQSLKDEKDVTSADMEEIKEALREIATDFQKSGEFHRSMGHAISPKKGK